MNNTARNLIFILLGIFILSGLSFASTLITDNQVSIGDGGNLSANWIFGNLDWDNLTNFPSDCGSGDYVYGISNSGSLRCRADEDTIDYNNTITSGDIYIDISGLSATLTSDATKWFYNQSDGVGQGNTSFNVSFTDGRYALIVWNYNQTQPFTDWLSTFQYDYNQTFEANKTIYETYNDGWVSTFNATYDTYAYNQSDGVGTGNASWNQTHADTLYADIKWGYNQTTVSGFDNTNIAYINNTQTFTGVNNFSDHASFTGRIGKTASTADYFDLTNGIDLYYGGDLMFDTKTVGLSTLDLAAPYIMFSGVTGCDADNEKLETSGTGILSCGVNPTGSGGGDFWFANFTGSFDDNYTDALWSYNQTQPAIDNLTDSYGQYWYNMTDGVGTGNSSWNQTYAETLFAAIDWGYNQTQPAIDNITNTWSHLWYNYTLIGGGDGSTENIFNQELNTTEEVIFNTVNATEEIFVAGSPVSPWLYNQSDGVGEGNTSWNQTHADTLYSPIIWGYNQTISSGDSFIDISGLVATLTSSATQWFYNQTLAGDNRFIKQDGTTELTDNWVAGDYNITMNDHSRTCYGDACDGSIYYNGTSLVIEVG